MCSIYFRKNGNENERDCVLTNETNYQIINESNSVTRKVKSVTKKSIILLKNNTKKNGKWKSEPADCPVIEKMEEKNTFVTNKVTKKTENTADFIEILLKKQNPKWNFSKNQLKKKTIKCNNMEETNFYCERCNYTTNRKANWIRHIDKKKHYKKLGLVCQMCSKIYSSKSGLWKHQQNPCKQYFNKKIKKREKKVNENIDNSSMIAEIAAQAFGVAITQLAEVQKEQQQKVEKKYDEMINHIIPKIGNNTTNNIVNNTINNKISIKLFLNEHCKDAINLQDFIQNIKLTPLHLQRAVMNGGVETISDVLVEKLTDLAPNERPIHCSDARRSHFYVKEKGEWARDNNTRKLDKAITSMQAKQFENLHNWIQKHPNWIHSTKLSNEYNDMTQQIAWTAEESRKAKRKIKRALMVPTDLKEAMQETSIN